MQDRNLFAELKRRNVWRAAVIYVAAAWALSQGIAQLAPYVGAPDWVVRWFLVACAIGFPFWIAFAWFYAWTPQGFKREEDVERDSALTRGTGRKLDFWIIGILAVAVVLLLSNQLVWHKTIGPNKATATIPEQSIAVLPLVDESTSQSQRYFSDGLSESLITALSQFAELKVIGRSSSFRFRNSQDSSKVIGEKLGVAHLLEGSVQYASGVVRINASLIDAADGSVLWSHRYERPYKDIFKLQDAITTAVAASLRAKLLPEHTVASQSDRPPSGNIVAYTALLQGKAQASNFTMDGLREAITFYQQAIKLDPNYAYAYAGLTFAEINLAGRLGGITQKQAADAGRAAAATALALEPSLGVAHQAHAAVLLEDGDAQSALMEYRRGLELNPHYAGAMSNLANGLAIVGQLDAAVAMGRKAIEADPLRDDAYSHLSNNLAALGKLDEANQVVRKAVALQPTNVYAHEMLATIDLLRGDTTAVLAWADNEPDPDNKLWFQTAAYIVAGDHQKAGVSLQAFISKYASDQPYVTAQLYALRQQPDTMFKWLDRAAAQPGSGIVMSLLSDPLVLRYKADPRFAALCKQLGLPAPGQPLPAAASTP